MGGSRAALGVALIASTALVAGIVLEQADRLGLSGTERTAWVVGGVVSVLAAWCALIALGV
jgi:hypothetical protein